MQDKDTKLHLTMKESLRDRIKELADMHNLSMASFIRMLVNVNYPKFIKE